MCGITAIYNKSNISSAYLRKANNIVAHRGPDDEGYLLWRMNEIPRILSGNDTSNQTLLFHHYQSLPDDENNWTFGMGHRRLSIVDLTPTGYQPMTLPERGLSITFNGEIFNYPEVREHLIKLGHQFHTGSDTEVILHAWAQWGRDSLHRFNGMFAFVLLDAQHQKLYAVRDRFGVKPLYYTDVPGYTAFGSEVKQLRTLPGYRFKLNGQIAYDYLRYGLIDHHSETFEDGIHQVLPGHFIELDVTSGRWKDNQWYSLKPNQWRGTEQEACDRFYELLKDSVRLRMRSDVPVGSALSGGLDSSTVVCLMREVLEDQNAGDHVIKTITSCSEDKKFDEWEFAEEVVKRVETESHKTFPSFEKLENDLDRMLWHMDYPFGSTSQFSQWCVFEEAKRQGLTVMIDGQGADEQLAGYGSNDIALYAGLLGSGKVLAVMAEAQSHRRRNGQWPVGFLLGAIQTNFRYVSSLLPERYQVLSQDRIAPNWLKSGKFREDGFVPKNLSENLIHQVQVLPLPSLLRYEDRNSMAFSVESRVPFMDYRLIEFTLGLPENLIYKNGERKHILRKTFRGLVPDKILDRTDKMGFVSAEERWMKEEGKAWFKKQFSTFSNTASDFIDGEQANSMLLRMQLEQTPFNFDPWRILCFEKWIGSID
jgi:asparagine synthase (glutamine-hydrolysing)